jgi:hypothetical protein
MSPKLGGRLSNHPYIFNRINLYTVGIRVFVKENDGLLKKVSLNRRKCNLKPEVFALVAFADFSLVMSK